MKSFEGSSSLPATEELEQELDRVKRSERYRRTLRSTFFTLVVVAAVSVLVAVLWMPVLQIFGASMNPTLYDGELVISLKTDDLKTGDVVSFYYNNKILVKRVIATAGDWVDIDKEGNVFVNGELLDEPYVSEKSLGDCDIELPYQVPESRVFVMGDHRSVSVDSRTQEIGPISEEQLVGKLVFRIWPLNHFGAV